MADDIGKKELGVPGYGPGYNPPGYGPGCGPDYGPGCGPGYPQPVEGNYLYMRLEDWVGTSVTAVFADGSIIRGSLHAVGRDYAEIHRRVDANREAVFIPLMNSVIIGPVR